MVSIQSVLFIFLFLYECGDLSVVSCQCVVGDIQTESSEYTVPGGYLDIDNPATCSGTLVKWHFCYRSEEINEPSAAWFRVWRQVSPPEYTLVHSHMITLTPTTTNDTLVCMEEMVNDTEQLEVVPGDIVGVYTPHVTNIQNQVGTPLHMYGVTTNGTGRLLRDIRSRNPAVINGDDINIMSDVEDVVGIVLHLYAEIINVSSTSILVQPTDQSPIMTLTQQQFSPTIISPTQQQFSPSTSTQQQFSPSPTSILGGNSGGDGSGDGGGNVGGIVAGVIVSLVVVAAIAAIIVIGVLLYRRRRGKLHSGNITRSTFSIDNSMYESPATVLARDGASIQATEYEIPVDSNHSRHTSAVETSAEMRSNYYPYPPGEFDSSDEENYDQEPGSGPPPAKNRTDIYNSFVSENSDYSRMLEAAVQSFSPQEGKQLEPYNPPPDDEQMIYEVLSKQNTTTIPEECICLSTEIESGRFGTVNQATMKYGKDRLDVMVKVLSTNAPEAEKIKFLQEVAIVAQFQHPNVMYCHGIIKEGNRLMLVLEYPHKGRLIDSLIEKRPSPGMGTGKFLLKTAQQVALGMCYLSGKKFVHRLLCTKSVFLSKGNICKIGEFGMSRDLADSNYYLAADNPIPVKWMAPESVNYHKFSAASDVWSYGCLLYELWSLGVEPFHNCADGKIAEKLYSGYRLPPPPGCPRTLYELMIKCWNPDPSARPTFQDLLLALMGKEAEILSIPERDATTHEQASILGAPLNVGMGMYSDLHQKYKPIRIRRETFTPSIDGVPTFDNEEYATTPKKSKYSSQSENNDIYEEVVDDGPQQNTHQAEEIYEDIDN